jgi:O-antigen ligase
LNLVSAAQGRSALRPWLLGLLILLALTTSAIGVANVIFGLSLAIWFARLSRERRWGEAFSSAIVFWIAIFVGLLCASALFSLLPLRSLPALKGVFTFLMLPLFADTVEDAGDAFAVTAAIGAAAAVLCGIGLWQYFHGADRLSDRITATLSHYMTFSGLLLLASLFYLGRAIEDSRRRLLWGSIASFLAATLLLTFTRNAYVGFSVALVVYLVLWRPRWLLAVPALLLSAYFLAPPDIRHRLLSIFNPLDETNRDRLDMAVAGVRMIRDFPVFGLGLTLVKPYYPLYRVPTSIRFRVPHLHNNLLQIAAESGLFAAAAYCAILACFFVGAGKLLRTEKDPERRGLLGGAFLAITGITAAGFFEYNFGDVEVLMTTLILMSIPFSRAFRDANRRA